MAGLLGGSKEPKGGLVIELGKPGKDDEPALQDDAKAECDALTNDAFEAVKSGDKEAFATALQDLIDLKLTGLSDAG